MEVVFNLRSCALQGLFLLILGSGIPSVCGLFVDYFPIVLIVGEMERDVEGRNLLVFKMEYVFFCLSKRLAS